MLVVAAALVRDGRVLAGLRRAGGWEFPGGKVESGESLADAVVRECREELAVDVEPIRELAAVMDGALDLRLWTVRVLSGTPTAGEDHSALRWVATHELDGIDWLPPDRALLAAVRSVLDDRRMRFRGNVELGGKTATGIEVPAEIIDALGTSKRPAVTITIGTHTYRTTAVRMGGRFLVPLSAENREAAGVAAGDEVDVDIALDDAPREVVLPSDLDAALDADARAAYDALSYTHRKEWVRWVEEAKKPETRAARVEKTVRGLKAGHKTH